MDDEKIVSNKVGDVHDKTENPDPKQDDMVTYSTYKKLLNQHKTVQENMRTNEAELQKFKDVQADAERKKLEEDGKYKELLLAAEKERDDWKLKASDLDNRFAQGLKISAFEDKLPGKILKREYLSFVNFENIKLDDTGEIDQESINQAVNQFVNDHPSLYSPKNKTRLPNDAPSDTKGQGLNYDTWLKLPAHEKLKRIGEVKK